MSLLKPTILRSMATLAFGGGIVAILSFVKPLPAGSVHPDAVKPVARFTAVLTGDNNFSSFDMTGSGTISAPAGSTVQVTLSTSPTAGFYLNAVTIPAITFASSGWSTIEASGQGPLTQPEVVHDSFVMPASGSVSWSGGFTICGSGSTGSVTAH